MLSIVVKMKREKKKREKGTERQRPSGTGQGDHRWLRAEAGRVTERQHCSVGNSTDHAAFFSAVVSGGDHRAWAQPWVCRK